MSLRFKDFASAAERAKNRINESTSKTYRQLLEEELKNSSSLDESFVITGGNGKDFFSIDLLEEIEKEIDIFRKELSESEIVQEAEGGSFDIKAYLQKMSNFDKAVSGIENAVKKQYDIEIQKVKKELEFEEKWPDYVKKEEDAIKNKAKAQLQKTVDPKIKKGIRAKKNADLAALDTKLDKVKVAKLKQFQESAEARLTTAKDIVKKLESPQSGLPEYGATIIANLKASAVNQGEIDLAEAKYKNDDAKLKKQLAMQKKREAERAKDIEEEMKEAEAGLLKTASKAADDVKGQNAQDANISKDDKEKFDDGKTLISEALSESQEARKTFQDLRTKLQAYVAAQNEWETAKDDEKDDKEPAVKTAESAYEEAADDFNTAKSGAVKALSSAVKWCNSNKDSNQSDIKSLSAIGPELKEQMDNIQNFEAEKATTTTTK